MQIELELWHLITLLLAFFGCVGAFGKILLSQFEKRLETHFEAQDKRFSGIENSTEKAGAEWLRLEREFNDFRASLPLTFVMRDDYVRNQTVIEAKLDAVAVRIENLQLKGVLR